MKMHKIKIFAASTDHWMSEMEDQINDFIKENGIVDFDIKITCSDYMVIAVLKYCREITLNPDVVEYFM